MEYDARKILRQERIYVTMTGVRLDVSFVPYAVETLYEDWIGKTAKIAGLIVRSKQIVGEIHDLEKRVNALAKESTERAQAEADLKSLMDEITGWPDMRKEAEKQCWEIIATTLQANAQIYTIDDLKKMLCREEPGILIQFIVGLDDGSKKNEVGNKASSSSGGSIHTKKSSASYAGNTESRGTRRSFAIPGKRSRK